MKNGLNELINPVKLAEIRKLQRPMLLTGFQRMYMLLRYSRDLSKLKSLEM
jgi:hypothetical protein